LTDCQKTHIRHAYQSPEELVTLFAPTIIPDFVKIEGSSSFARFSRVNDESTGHQAVPSCRAELLIWLSARLAAS
jgi:hypothetical protein